MEAAPDAPNANTPTGRVVARWAVIAMLLAFGCVYVMMLLIGFNQGDALWLAGMSSVPLAVAVVVALLVWEFYWTPKSK